MKTSILIAGGVIFTGLCVFVGYLFLKGPDTPNACGDKCGENAECTAEGCVCEDGFEGDPKVRCDQSPGPDEETCKNTCGPRTECDMYGKRPLCGCQAKSAGNPYDRNQGCNEVAVAGNAKCWSEDREDASTECIQYSKQKPKKTFTIMTEESSWFEAHKLCESGNRMLAIIENSFDRETLENQIIGGGFSNKRFWLAGSNLKHTRTFQWVAGKTFNSIEYTNWALDEPKGGNQNCVAMSDRFSWFTEDCSRSFAFVCMNK